MKLNALKLYNSARVVTSNTLYYNNTYYTYE